MTNWHVLDKNGPNFRIAYHIAIPNQNNGSGVNYRTAVINSKLGGTTILPDGDGTSGTLSTAEKTTILNGSVVERVVTLDPTQGNPATSGATMVANINADFTANSQSLLDELQAKLIHFGRTG